jgi:hypothetical protein
MRGATLGEERRAVRLSFGSIDLNNCLGQTQMIRDWFGECVPRDWNAVVWFGDQAVSDMQDSTGKLLGDGPEDHGRDENWRINALG